MKKMYFKLKLFFFSDERDAIQKKTFTKWVNKHLKKVCINEYFMLHYLYIYL